MLQILSQHSKEIRFVPHGEGIESDAIWYDLINPESDEISKIEQTLKVQIPSLAKMSEIEESSRLYEEKGILYMEAVLLATSDIESPILVPATFIMTQNSIITIRYSELKSFQFFTKKIGKNGCLNSQTLFWGLIDTVIEKIADILELNSADIDEISNKIFKSNRSNASREMRKILIHIGKAENLNSKVRESLVTIDRLLIFYNQMMADGEQKVLSKVSTLQKDVKSLVNYVTFSSNKIEFLLDATLGFIEIEQNGIIKFFSVAAVIFLPPMVIASIYGMNFSQIPELHWAWGYPFALALMILSAVLPYYYFKKRGWL